MASVQADDETARLAHASERNRGTLLDRPFVEAFPAPNRRHAPRMNHKGGMTIKFAARPANP
jgi:hypothetical protein